MLNLNILYLLLQLAVTAFVFWLGYRLLRGRLSTFGRIAAALLGLCALFISISVSAPLRPTRQLTLTALGEKNPAAAGCEITLSSVKLNGIKESVPPSVSGSWTWLKKDYRWFPVGDERRADDQTDSVTFSFDALAQVELVFTGNPWKGVVELESGGTTQTLDTYLAESGSVSFTLPALSLVQFIRAVAFPLALFILCLLGLSGVLILVFMAGRVLLKGLLSLLERRGPFRRLLRHQFLFEELVKRDFKKKYKRTVLGMAWSVLSPLLTLFVMRLVFTQFFGRTTPHYTIYLFCGNLVFTYFNESTSQGMTSLVGNAAIFTKVNVPKYLFLLSKNVQTLINFGLTLCVFLTFCVFDQIAFTWRFILLLYPIVMLLFFNLGVGLILSALFVFFKDIQYLWSVFTMLLMYMSAIFYTIDKYDPSVQNLFLLNPVYLFIRYFRKIVIEATIPSLWFHLLILADVLIVIGVGCWMYKKNNTKFLYYV